MAKTKRRSRGGTRSSTRTKKPTPKMMSFIAEREREKLEQMERKSAKKIKNSLSREVNALANMFGTLSTKLNHSNKLNHSTKLNHSKKRPLLAIRESMILNE
jgi:hypothetical protein